MGTVPFVKPTIEEISDYFKERDSNEDPEHFFDYYESNGWKIGGRAGMKCWRAAIRNWIRNSMGYRQNHKKSVQQKNLEDLDAFMRKE